ncbi:response regulator transcription factor [Paenibacillus tuaregi]|uniref:response regulator transcription factor n=1 Tax=Paenibacillus tuaregi TaxID=1816681 RepID=UPI0009ECEA82|nr:response regulator transcription factor [Paenibacillus tuaregi]
MKIIIAEDQSMLRGALSALLDLEEDIEVIGQAENGARALELILQLSPDICLLDIEMPDMTGLDVAEKLQELRHPCRVMILTTFSRAGYFQRAIRAGASGYLLKDAPVDELGAALRRIHAGGKVISPELSMTFWQTENPLTDREQEVLGRLAQGHSVKEIASELFLSYGTVRNYVSEIIQKLEAKNRIDAISIAEKMGWLD